MEANALSAPVPLPARDAGSTSEMLTIPRTSLACRLNLGCLARYSDELDVYPNFTETLMNSIRTLAFVTSVLITTVLVCILFSGVRVLR
jgi:hypothetical protein